jgi:hypothetical protein
MIVLLALVAYSTFIAVRHVFTPLPWARSPATLDHVVGVVLYVLPLLPLVTVIVYGVIMLTLLVRSDALRPVPNK